MNTAHPLAATLAQIHRLSLDYVPGELDRTAPPRIWLQIDTGGSNDERDEPWPGADGVTWQDEQIGGLEIEYVRADLAALPGGGVDGYEAKYATAERLAKPAATEHCDFCGVRPSDLHAYDCTALDEERQSQLLLPDEKLFAGAARDHHHGYVSGWNECLHRVVAMNQRGGK